MAEALKHFFDRKLITSLAESLASVFPGLDRRRFIVDATRGLADLELLARGAHIAAAMRRHLPEDYPTAARLLIASLGAELVAGDSHGMAPFRYLPHVCFVAAYGLSFFEPSMEAQLELTKRFSAEFSIRPFIERYPERTYERLSLWAAHPNVHVRRLVSEGTRPRLPWASRLPGYQRDPTPVLALLERLKDDPERYVQRSVANNLNDIGKDHPERLVQVCRAWSEGAGDGRRWIVKHALRSLIKRGHPGALALMGVGARPRVAVRAVSLTPPRPRRGDVVRLSFELASTGRATQDLLVDYAVFFVKASGERRPKVFKLRRLELPPRRSIQLEARVSFVDMTTRRHYAGRHAAELLVNGVRVPLCEFDVR
jgi:3-methyladenine DNA glycosylase AlkC